MTVNEPAGGVLDDGFPGPVEAAELLAGIHRELEYTSLKRFELGDFASCLTEYDGGLELQPAAIHELYQYLDFFGFRWFPHQLGNASRGLAVPLVLFLCSKPIDHGVTRFRAAALLMKACVIMTRADGVIQESELDRLFSAIRRLQYLGEDERTYIKAQALFFLQGRTRRDLLLNKLCEVSPSAQDLILDCVMDVAIADGVLQKSELAFLQDIYRAFGKPARSARSDIERYAREHYVVLQNEVKTAAENEVEELAYDELDDVLGDLLGEFDF